MTGCIGTLHVNGKSIPPLVGGLNKIQSDGKHSDQHSSDVGIVTWYTTHS